MNNFLSFLSLSIGIALGLSIVYFGYKKWHLYQQAREHWQVIEATVVGISIQLHFEAWQGSGHFVYPKLSYCYEYSNQTYRANRYAFSKHEMLVDRPQFNDLVGRYDELDVWWNRLRLGDTILIRLTPQNPQEAIVEYEGNLRRGSYYFGIMLIGILIIIFMGWLGLISLYS